MTPKPIGTVKCVDEQGAEDIDFSNHNPYERSVALFIAAIKGTSQPAATGIDGIKSLAVALAVKESATTGQAVHVNYGRITL
jgi:1,5-anhydro-D-fructose reductase (1,5-anhydro-D-mannitol-forming)